MKRLLKGFTLAEVLITLAVIGVVATVTMPILNSKVAESQVGPSLMKAINTLSNANNLVIRTNDVRRLDQLSPMYFNALHGYLANNSRSDVQAGTELNPRYDTTIVMNDGMEFKCDNKISSATGTIPNRYAGKYFTVTVDINGGKAPNAAGKDIFTLWIDTKGEVIPYGGEAHKNYLGSSATVWSTACTGSTVTDPASCTGSVVDNNGKVTYNYRF